MGRVGVRWLVLSALLSAAGAYDITDEQYHEMPRLFHLDDYDACLSSRRGAFCLGSFQLLPHSNPQLLQYIQAFSEDKYHFNHTWIHRGVCMSGRCAQFPGPSLRSRFEQCVDNATVISHGLAANLTRLEYCRVGRPARPVDRLDVAFAYVCLAILLLNLAGTAYDLFRNQGGKPNKYLLTWSLRVNWRRLTADYSDGDPRLAALRPVQGIKALTLILIMLAHSVLAHHITYIYNPLFFEKASHHPMSAYFQNGTSIVQSFILVSSFLLAYNMLLHAETTKRPLGLATFPRALLHRISRIYPVYLFVLGVAVTWWAHSFEGPLWTPLVGAECSRCRDKWWTQVLFVNNLVRPDVRCLIHTWFLAVDMQLYVVSTLLTLALGRRPRLAVHVLAALLALSVAANFTAAYIFQLKPMVKLMFPEYMRTQFESEVSFTWLYQAPWDSMPAALVGLLLAFLQHRVQHAGAGCQPGDSAIMLILYRLSVPCMFLWVFLGYLMKGVSAPAGVALYAALDRPVFVSLTAVAMYGFFNKIDSLWWRFLSWRGWEVLGRMSLSVYLIHWLVALMQLAMRSHLSPVSIHEIGGHFLWTVFVSYCAAFPLHLFVELPMQKFLQSILS